MHSNNSIHDQLIKVQKSSCLELDDTLIYNLTKLLNHRREIAKMIRIGDERNNFLALRNDYNYCDTQIKLLLSL